MKKSVGVICLVSMILLLSVSFVSAGWFGDFLDKLFGGDDDGLEGELAQSSGVEDTCESRGQLPWCDVAEGETASNCPQDCSYYKEGEYIQKNIEGYTLTSYSWNNGLSNYENIIDRILISYIKDSSQQNVGLEVMHFNTEVDADNFFNNYISEISNLNSTISKIDFNGFEITEIIMNVYDIYSWNWKKNDKVIKVRGFINPEDNEPMPSEIISSYLVKYPIQAVPLICTDSDGGKDYYVKGKTVPNIFDTDEDACYSINEDSKVDSCSGENCRLVELYCIDAPVGGQSAVLEYYNCPNGCEDGACVGSPETCTESWSCNSWSTCSNSQQTRTCTDSNSCGTTENKPLTSKTCTVQQKQENQTQQITSKIKSYIADREVTVEGNANGENIIQVEEESVKTFLDVVEESEKIYIKTSEGNKEIDILPREAIATATKIENVEEVRIIEEKGEAVYLIIGTKKARLFFIVPILAEVEQKVNVENGNLVSTKKPWWAFLAFGI